MFVPAFAGLLHARPFYLALHSFCPSASDPRAGRIVYKSSERLDARFNTAILMFRIKDYTSIRRLG